jgi:ketosteroid isomerase-like protein
MRFAPLLVLAVLLSACGAPPSESDTDSNPEQEIRNVLDEQVAAWNDGSLADFMDGYWQSDSLRFASGGNIRTGWDETLAAYERGYPDRAAMGTLAFGDLDIRVLSPEWAMVFGQWELEREQDRPSGLFTLLMQRRAEGWRVVHDHTSSAN